MFLAAAVWLPHCATRYRVDPVRFGLIQRRPSHGSVARDADFLPELVTSIIATLRRHGDVALSNILGSNIYNILGIGGVTALIAPTVVPPEILHFDGLVMIAVSLMILVIALIGYRINRVEGAAFLACYALYIYAIWPV